jgi:RNA polymerase sigma-70 factor (ECF subfamily)
VVCPEVFEKKVFQMMQNQSDNDLVQQILAGDDAAFDELMRRHKRSVLNFLYKMLGNDDDADDLAQETFVRAYQNLKKFRAGTNFSAWIFTIAANLGRDRLRWRARRPAEELDASLTDGKPSASDEILQSETAKLVREAVGSLPEEQKMAVILVEFHDFSYAEAAKIARCSAKAIETRLYHAKQKLREKLAPLLGSENF